MATGTGTKDDPWQLTTPPGSSAYQMWRDDTADPPVIVCQVGRHPAQVRRPGHRGAPRLAHGAGRLGPARRGRRAEAGAGRLGRGVGPLRDQPARRLVRPQEGPARTLRRVHAAAPGGARPGRADPRAQGQQDARALARVHLGAPRARCPRPGPGSQKPNSAPPVGRRPGPDPATHGGHQLAAHEQADARARRLADRIRALDRTGRTGVPTAHRRGPCPGP